MYDAKASKPRALAIDVKIKGRTRRQGINSSTLLPGKSSSILALKFYGDLGCVYGTSIGDFKRIKS